MANKIISHDTLKRLLHYSQETGLFTNLIYRGANAQIGTSAGSINSDGYLLLKIYGRTYSAHRLAWFYINGAWPNEIDHINRIKTDNRISNLSSGTRSDNQHNMPLRSTNKSGYTGVSFCKSANKWIANITVNSNRTYLRIYSNIEDAITARKTAEHSFVSFSNHVSE